MAADWEQLQSLFEGALSHPRHERAAYLEAQTGSDRALRRDVESLLAAHEAADQFLGSPAVGPLLPPLADSLEPSAGEVRRGRLATGASVGPFLIQDLLGAGGMGEVYRALDTRLDRPVAIKVLSPAIDTVPRSRERFERETRTIARLSHPRICTMHDVGLAKIDGRETPFLVMELLVGETLAARLARGPLPIDDALACAIDIADALIAAHAQAIVHRDLKPANVMLTSTGIKLLDFGLAQLRSRSHRSTGPTGDAAGLSTLTSAGMVFGTLPYISPEQLRGEPVDARTDVFAFGAVLHEMLTGVRAFVADSQAGLIAAILEHDAPPLRQHLPSVPAGLERVIAKCLAKAPDDRWQTARDLKSELEWVRDGGGGPILRSALRRRPSWWPRSDRIVAAIPSVVALVLAGLLWLRGSDREPSRTSTRLALNLPPDVTLDIPINGPSFTIAPDGSRIAFVGRHGGRLVLYVHTLETGKTLAVPDTSGARFPTFSPDSQWVAFAQGNSVRKVPAAGGPAQLVWDRAPGPMVWMADGRLARSNGTNPLREIGNSERSITELREHDEGHMTPLTTENGSVLFTALRGGFLSTVNTVAAKPPDGPIHDVVTNATTPHLLAPDLLLFAQGRSLLAAGFDPGTLRLTGEPRAVDITVQTTQYSAAPMYAVSNNGTLVYAERAPGRRLVWIDRNGREEPAGTEERMYAHFRLSPDGTRVAASVVEDDNDIWVLALDGSLVQRLSSGPTRDAMPVWSPDGERIYFTTAERRIHRVAADRSVAPVEFFAVPRPERLHATSITPDGSRLVMHWDVLPKSIDVRVLELTTPPTLTRLLSESGTERDGQVSPDGRWIAFQSAASLPGQLGQIVVRPFPDTNRYQRVVSPGLGGQPIWSRDGRELFYRTADGTLMAATVKAQPGSMNTPPSFEVVRTEKIPTPALALSDWSNGPTYGVSPDGRRFLFIKAPELDIRSLTVILNWDAEVRSLLAQKE
jgi:serine/threonine-protein kinase